MCVQNSQISRWPPSTHKSTPKIPLHTQIPLIPSGRPHIIYRHTHIILVTASQVLWEGLW